MELFVGQVPHNATLRDLSVFLGPFRDDARFQLIKQDKLAAPSVYYGLVIIDSDRVAQKAMRKLNGQPLAGQSVVVREFAHRVYSNDRRAINWRMQPWQRLERRLCDRRTPDFVEEKAQQSAAS